MTEDRLPAGLEAAAIRRQVESSGGNAVVIRRGDPDRGLLILELRQRGQYHSIVERGPGAGGASCWQTVGPPGDSIGAELSNFIEKRIRFDPDCWLIELDVPDAQRFVAELGTIG